MAIYVFLHLIWGKNIFPPTPHKTPTTFFGGVEMTPNFQESCKTKIYSLKNQHGPSARANFSNFHFSARGGNFTPQNWKDFIQRK